MMRYLITGATSGTGNAVLQRLTAKVGCAGIACLVRRTSDTRLPRALGVSLHEGDITDAATLAPLLSPETIYLDMTHPRYYPGTLAALTAAGVRRAYFVTTTGIFSRYHSCSAIYQLGETLIRDSGLVYTILRPSMIYGTARDKNMHRLLRVLDRYPVFPLFNHGLSLMQPVYVDDLADGIVAAVGDERTAGQAYNLAGPAPLRYLDIIEIILAQLGRNVRLLNINTQLAYLLVRGLQWVPGFPITAEQVLRLKEDKVFDIAPAAAALGYRPRSFAAGIRREIDTMRQAGLLRARQDGSVVGRQAS